MTSLMRTTFAGFFLSATAATLFSFGVTQVAADTTVDLVGHWMLDEGGAATSAVDSVSGNNGTWQGTSPHYVSDGPSGVANSGIFSYDDGQYVSIPHNSSYDFSTYFSASLWIKATAWNPWNALLGKDVWDTQEGWALYVNDQSGGLGSLCYEAPVNGTICTDHLIPLSTWVHIVVTNDHGDAAIYIDGVQSASGSVPLQDSSVDLYIGARHNNDGTGVADNFIGSISDVRLYSQLLNSEDIQALYTRTSSSSSASVAATQERVSVGGSRGHGTTTIHNKQYQNAMPSLSNISVTPGQNPTGNYRIILPSVTVRAAGGMRLAKGDAVDVIRFLRQGRLAKIRLPSGKTGYILAKAIVE